MKSIAIGLVLLIILVAGIFGVVSADDASDAGGRGPLPSFVDADGTIHFPGRVRDKWTHLGSWGAVDVASEDAAQHDVYTRPETLAAYRKTGKFPDGSVLIKELRKIKSANMTTGHMSWAGEELLWFVMIKDTEGRFEGNGNWGNGWGWALFNAGATDKNASENFQADCLGCHIPARATDWVYIHGYPSLRAND
jgi:hypothetical protein